MEALLEVGIGEWIVIILAILLGLLQALAQIDSKRKC